MTCHFVAVELFCSSTAAIVVGMMALALAHVHIALPGLSSRWSNCTVSKYASANCVGKEVEEYRA